MPIERRSRQGPEPASAKCVGQRSRRPGSAAKAVPGYLPPGKPCCSRKRLRATKEERTSCFPLVSFRKRISSLAHADLVEQCAIQAGADLDGLFKTPVCEFDVFRVEFNPDVLTTMLYCCDARRCGAGKRIQHDSTFRTSSQQARFRQVRRKYCGVRASERPCRHRPDGPLIASVAIWRKSPASVLLRIANRSAA